MAEAVLAEPSGRLVANLVRPARPDLDMSASRVEREKRPDDRVAGLILVASRVEPAPVLVAAGAVQEVRAVLGEGERPV